MYKNRNLIQPSLNKSLNKSIKKSIKNSLEQASIAKNRKSSQEFEV